MTNRRAPRLSPCPRLFTMKACAPARVAARLSRSSNWVRRFCLCARPSERGQIPPQIFLGRKRRQGEAPAALSGGSTLRVGPFLGPRIFLALVAAVQPAARQASSWEIVDFFVDFKSEARGRAGEADEGTQLHGWPSGPRQGHIADRAAKAKTLPAPSAPSAFSGPVSSLAHLAKARSRSGISFARL